MKKIYALITILFIGLATHCSGQATFTFTNAGSNAQVDAALDYVGQIWGQYLNSPVTIKVQTYYAAIGAGTTLAVTIPNGRRDFASAPVDSLWYPSCLANKIAGTELNPGEADMDIIINSSVNWYFGLDGNPGVNQYDFVTVLLHEVGHGLGYLSIAKLDGNEGSFGYVTLADITPFTPSFPFPQLAGKYSIFSYYMEDGANVSLRDTSVYPNPSLELGAAFISNDLYFDAPISVAANGGSPVKIFAPTTYASGSSIQHINEASYPSGSPNALMTPYVNDAEVHHEPGTLTLAMLEDMGWSVNYAADIPKPEKAWAMVYPNPAGQRVFLQMPGYFSDAHYTLTDVMGNVVMQGECTFEINGIDLDQLANGVYIMNVFEGEMLRDNIRVVKQ